MVCAWWWWRKRALLEGKGGVESLPLNHGLSARSLGHLSPSRLFQWVEGLADRP